MAQNSFENYFLSWKPDRKRLTRPVYLALANLLEEDIDSGKLAPGTKLPPQRELADYLDINFTTVTRAYTLCRDKKLIYAVTGRGSFVEMAPGKEKQNTDIIELGVVAGFPQVSKDITIAMQSVVAKGYLDRLCTYSAPAGLLHQRAAGAQFMLGMGVETDPEHTAVFSGAQSVISTALLALFKIGDRIAVDEYTYFNFIGAAKMAHIILEPVSGDEYGMLPDELDKICQRKKISGIFLMPYCANPTAVSMSQQRIVQVAEIIKKHDLILIEDDHSHYLASGRTLFSYLPDNTVYICGSSMSLCGGLRLTFAAFAEKYRQKLLGTLNNLSITTSSIDAELVTELITSRRAERILKTKKNMTEEANAVFYKIFPELEVLTGSVSPFRTLPLPEVFHKHDGQTVENYFRSCGVNVYHSSRFAVKKQHDAFLRLSLSSTGNLQELACGLEKVKQAVSAAENHPEKIFQ